MYHLLGENKQKKERMTISTKQIFIKVGVIIFLFIGLLILTPILSERGSIYWSSICAGLILTGYSLYILVKYMIEALDSVDNRTNVSE